MAGVARCNHWGSGGKGHAARADEHSATPGGEVAAVAAVVAMTPRIIARRGASVGAPENTFAAAHLAARCGADLVAVDVRASAEQTFHLLRDPTVDRTTDGVGPIAELSDAEIDRLDAGTRHGVAFAGEPVPRLDRFLAAMRGRFDFVLELHAGDPGALGHALRSVGLDRRCLVHPAGSVPAAELARSAPFLSRIVAWPEVGSVEAARDSGAKVLWLRGQEAGTARIAEALRARMDVMVTIAGDGVRPLSTAIAAGVRYLDTARPDLVDAVRRQMSYSD